MPKLFSFLCVMMTIFIFSFAGLAQVKGKGEVTGEVMNSWLAGEQVRFRLSISTQQNWNGPRLANPNNFAYSGADKMRITEGDKISLTYNSSDGDYILVQSLEFASDRPGEIDQTSYLLPVLLGLTVLAIAAMIIYLIRRKQRDLHTT